MFIEKKNKLLESPKAARISSKTTAKAQNTPQLGRLHRRQDDADEEFDSKPKDRKYLVEDEDASSKGVTSSEDSDSDGDEHSWLDGSTIIAQFGEA